MKLPKTVRQRYKLCQGQNNLGKSSAKKGVYLDTKTSRLVFIKIDNHRKLLTKEFMNQKLLYAYAKDILNTGITIPKPVEIIEDNKLVALVMEYIPAKIFVKAQMQKRLDTYMSVLKFLNKINVAKLNIKNNLQTKSSIDQLVTIPYFLSKNLLLYPTYAALFFRSTKLILSFIPQWRKLTSDWICHGDINVTNILEYGKNTVVVDFASSCLSHRYFDISRTLNSAWFVKDFHENLFKQVSDEFQFSNSQQKILISFVVFNLMQRLSQRYENIDQARFYLERLKAMLDRYE